MRPAAALEVGLAGLGPPGGREPAKDSAVQGRGSASGVTAGLPCDRSPPSRPLSCRWAFPTCASHPCRRRLSTTTYIPTFPLLLACPVHRPPPRH